ncbi:DNA replication and repair protein RecF [Fulvivirgaceae bacterium BMA12]|uniref:DNA replication and repair protein RecF n=1 Tax=Agaribacillus aureus TaxID=3051825 RepID=A0ABT8LET1_9BACT|nr:DNA replication and repair protein RecF [Fulvivirgaceae bacterium BMA12]
MHLENISLNCFKNYSTLEVAFPKEINCFVGANGSGKTNLLDAIHYLSLTKSAFNIVDNQNIQHDKDYFSIRGNFRVNTKKYQVQCSLQLRQKKVVKLNQKPYEKISEHIGKFPLVLINPHDTDIIRGGGEGRRRFFDVIISQIDPAYLGNLMQYNHGLKQRNSLLKQFAESGNPDMDLIAPYDQIILDLGHKIHLERSRFVTKFVPIFEQHYKNLSEQKEHTSLHYTSELVQPDFDSRFRHNLQRDMALHRTGLGIHKDDYVFKIEDYPLKKFGSQGQQKSFVIALKLAQYDIIKDQKAFKPLLLLDDIFDKLDDFRIKKLMQMLGEHKFGQIFVTDARPERTRAIFESLKSDMDLFLIESGNIKRIE